MMRVSVCLSMCVSVCLSAIMSLELHLWQRNDTLCMDDVIFAHKPRLLDIATRLKGSAHAALGLAKTVRSNTSCRPTDAWDYFLGT